VSITAPANNAAFAAPAAITINVNAVDTDGTIAKVDFYNGTTLLGTDTTSPYSFAWTNVAVGTYTITAKATDDKGALTTSAAITVKVNANVAPTVSITAPANNASFTAPAAITINATATDTDGTIAKVDFYNGTTLLGTDTTSPYSYSWANVAAGTYSITAKATDDKGAITTSSAISVTVGANQVPTVSITSPANNASFAAPANITINANAADADGTISKVEFYNGTTLLGTDTTSPYFYAWSNVAAGTYSVTAKATDNKGAVTTSIAVSVSVSNNQLPTITFDEPIDNGPAIYAPADITLGATASDVDGTIAKVEFFKGTTKLGEATAVPYRFVWAAVTAGTYSLTAKATDNIRSQSAHRHGQP
jgi:Bacterial Ig domain